MRRTCLILMITLAGCGDKVIERRVIRTWQAEGMTSCYYTCLGIDWETGGPVMDSCSGEQRSKLQFTEYETIYETDIGGAEKGRRAERHVGREILERLEACR